MINGPPNFGVSHLGIIAYVYEYLGLGGYGSRSLESLSYDVKACASKHRYVIT